MNVLPYCVALAACFFISCTAPVSVKHVKPPAPEGAIRSSSAVALIKQIRLCEISARGGDPDAVVRYNDAVARLIEILGKEKYDPWSQQILLSDENGSYRISGISPSATPTGPGQLTPVDTLRFKGRYAQTRAVIDGVGAPLVSASGFDGIGSVKCRQEIPVRNVTAMVRFKGDQHAVIELLDPLQKEQVMWAGKRYRLAADHGAAMQVTVAKARIDKLGFSRLIHPSRYDHTANLNFTQPYDSKRIPVLLVHGIDSTPATFAPMYTKFLQDEEIRRHYQFWVFSYPSGYPYHYSAALLRREIDAVKREFPGHQNMVIIGHSMGGVIGKLMLTDAQDRLWMKSFGKTPQSMRWLGSSRKLLEEVLIFSDRPEIDRAIFFSAPHRGSELAMNPLSRALAAFIKMPSVIADARNAAMSIATADTAGLLIQSTPNSIASLSPRNPFVVAVNELPISSRVPHHTIVGDRGKANTPQSSDGVVPYWSAHLPTASSEKVVPSGHSSHIHHEGVDEAARILRIHLQQRGFGLKSNAVTASHD